METIQQPTKIRQTLDQATAALRWKREDFWMEELHDVYPYGLNNRLRNSQDQQDEEISVRTLYTGKQRKKKHSQRSPLTLNKTAHHIYDIITDAFQKRSTPNHNSEQLNSAIISAQIMNKAELKKMGGMAHEDIIKDCNIPLRLLHTIIDLTAAKLHVKTDEKTHERKIKHAFTVRYCWGNIVLFIFWFLYLNMYIDTVFYIYV